MKATKYDIQIISAPSILGVKPCGVEMLGERLLASGLEKKLGTKHPVIHVPTLNSSYNYKRDPETKCLNPKTVKKFSLILDKVISNTMKKKRFAFVMGGDCSILIGIMPALKAKGNYGLIFFDAHADFYKPDKSTTGQLADMDLAIITGRGPELLTNIKNLQPYVKDENVIHVGQRDWKETKGYGSEDIRQTAIKCFSLTDIKKKGLDKIISKVLQRINQLELDGFWIHFDTDVLSDKINPTVAYRLPGGLSFKQIEKLISSLLLTGKMMGISITIFNPSLDKKGHIAKKITDSIGRAFDFIPPY